MEKIWVRDHGWGEMKQNGGQSKAKLKTFVKKKARVKRVRHVRASEIR